MQINLRIQIDSKSCHKVVKKYNSISMLIYMLLQTTYKITNKVRKTQRFHKLNKLLSILKIQIMYIYLLNFQSMNRKSRRKKKKAYLREYFQKEIKSSAILPTMKNLIISKHNSRIKSSQLS